MRALLVLILLTSNTAHACINIEGVTIDGKYRQVEAISQEDGHPVLQETLHTQPSSRLAALTSAADDEQVDAVRDIYSGNYDAAIKKLEAIEATHPGEYSTAANLGTAYELAGDNKKALYWISEGIKRNEHSHYGSEWLHKKILETKIAMESEPKYLERNHILPIDDNTVWKPEFKYAYGDKIYSSYELARALHYQLGERMLFVKPEDPVVADLLYSFAILEANTRVLEPAVELIKLSKEYGYHDGGDIDAKIAKYQQVIDKTFKFTREDAANSVVTVLFWGGALATLYSVLFVLYRILQRRRAQLGQ